jgi:hypothetical protein
MPCVELTENSEPNVLATAIKLDVQEWSSAWNGVAESVGTALFRDVT